MYPQPQGKVLTLRTIVVTRCPEVGTQSDANSSSHAMRQPEAANV